MLTTVPANATDLELWGDFSNTTQLNQTSSGDQINPSIAALPNDQFVAIWSDRAGNDGDRGGIFGRIYDSTMEPVSGEFLVNTLTSDWQSKSSVAGSTDGNFMAVWHQATGVLEGQVFDSAGNKLGAQFTVHNNFNKQSDITVDPDGNFWVASDAGVSGVNRGYVSKFSSGGDRLVDTVPFSPDVDPFQVDIAALSDGRVVVTWHDGGNPAGSEIYAQIISATGGLVGERFVVNETLAENQSHPSIAGLASGGFVVVWQSFLQDGELFGIYGRQFDSEGTGGAEFRVNTETAATQTTPFLLGRSEGGFVVGWTDGQSPQQVYIRSFEAGGDTFAETSDTAISLDGVTTVNGSENLELTQLSSGGYVASWDAWTGSREIFGRTFSITSEFIGPCPLVVLGNGLVSLTVTSTGGSGFAIDNIALNDVIIDFEDATVGELISDQYAAQGLIFEVLSDDSTNQITNVETGNPHGVLPFSVVADDQTQNLKALHVGANGASTKLRLSNPADQCFPGYVESISLRLGDGDGSPESFLIEIDEDAGLGEYEDPTEGPVVSAEFTTGSGPIDGGVTVQIDLAGISVVSDDSDGDGVDDNDDAFPVDPAASVDSDGDGYPDAWNEGATAEQIAASSLVIDAFPNDKFEAIDADNDGVGAGVDVDDNDSGVGYQSFASALGGISDSKLRACIENTNATAVDISQVTSVFCGFPENDVDRIASLTGLEAFKRLSYLSLDGGRFDDITPISPLERLTYLYMSNGDSGLTYGDITPLAGLSELEHVELDHWVYNKAAIDSWSKLRILVLHDQTLTAFPDFSANPSLQILNMSRGAINDLSLVTTAPNLTELDLSSNAVSATGQISGLSNLRILRLWNNQLTDIAGLELLTQLEDLSITPTVTMDLAPLSALIQLERFYLDAWNVPNLDAQFLADLPNLYQLDINAELGVILPTGSEAQPSMPSLLNLTLRGDGFADAAYLADTPNLNFFQLSWVDVPLVNIGLVGQIPTISYLELSQNKAMTEVPDLSNLDVLQFLELSNSAIIDVSNLVTVNPTSIQRIALRENNVVQIGSALDGFSGGSEIDFSDNPLRCSEATAQSQRSDINFVFNSNCLEFVIADRPLRDMEGYRFDAPGRIRATYYYAVDDNNWSFPFELADTSYQFGLVRWNCDYKLSVWPFEQERVFTFCDTNLALSDIHQAFKDSGSEVRLSGRPNNAIFSFDHASNRDSEVIFFDPRSVSSVGQNSNAIDAVEITANHLRLTRPVPGTGGGEGASANCASFRYAENSLRGLSPQLEIDNGRWGRLKTFFNNVIMGGESQVFERRDVSDDAVFVCSDTPPGTYEINGAILDGRGGKQEFELTVEITEAQVAGGSAEWSMTSTSDSDGDGVPDDDDAFPSDPAASVDTDGDGSPDDWNPNATAEQIAASTLTLDDDDDNDGTPDIDDYFPIDPSKVGTPLSEALGGVVDPKLASCIASQSSGLDYAEQLQRLDCGDIDNLEGLRAFSYLSEFFIDNNTTDFSELAYLTRLTLLEQDNGPAPETLEPLRGNTNLTFLQLQGVNGQTLELDVIESLINLEQLRFNYSDIPTLPDFSQLAHLASLDIYRTNTHDITNVSFLSGLTHFGSYDNPLTDISPVSALTQLTRLTITDTDATDITPLVGLTGLIELVIPGNNFLSLAPLVGLTQLNTLWVGRNPELDLSFLPNAPSLTELRIGSTGLTDLSVLANVPNVQILDISRNEITDYSPLAMLDSLYELRADRMTTPLQSLGQLPAVPTLRNLWLWGNEITVLTDTQNPWATFHYLPSNPVTCEVVQEFMAIYPSSGVYDADNECVAGRLLERPSNDLSGYTFDSPLRERAVYYYATDDFTWAFPFAFGDYSYQLSPLGGFCSSRFTFDINGTQRVFRYGTDENECEPGWDIEAIQSAFVAGGDQLRVKGGGYTWAFDHPTLRDSEVLFQGLGVGNVSSTTWSLTTDDVDFQANYLRLTRPTPGSGQVDYGNGNNCVAFGGDDSGKGLAGLAPQLLAGPLVGDGGRLKVFFNDLITGGETQVFERRDVTEDAIFVCSDTPTGVREISGVVLDGRGGKLPFDLTVEITETQAPGGDAQWSMESGVDLGEGLVLHLPFDGNTYDVISDPAGLNPAQTAEGTTFNPGVIGAGMFGRAAIMPEQMPAGFDADSYTVSFWAKRLNSDPCTGDYLVEYRPVQYLGGPPTIGDGLGLVTGGASCTQEGQGKPTFAWGYNEVGRQALYTEQNPDNEWHLYTGVVRAEGELELYIDGSLVAAQITPKEILDVTGPLQIGSFYYGCDCAFDDFRIYNRALDNAEVANLFNMAGETNDYLFYEPFDTETGTVSETLAEYDRLTTIRPDPVRVVDGRLDLIPTGERGRNLAYAVTIKEQFAGDLEMEVQIGGEGNAPGSFAVGVTVGNNILLFHPGLEGGQFRREIYDNATLSGVQTNPRTNFDMGFTPAQQVLHFWTISVDGQSGLVRITVYQGDNPNNQYQFEFTDTRLLEPYTLGVMGEGNVDAGYGYIDSITITGNYANPSQDSDGDGVPDIDDAFPNDLVASVDTDGDGSPDYWNQGATSSEINASVLVLDAFPNDPAASVDSDGDGYPDSWNGAATDQQIADSNLTLDAFPNDSTEWIDTDGDGIGNNADDDDDNDGIPDVDDLFPLVKAVAFDEDYDGIADSIDAFPQISSRGFVDTDFDGAPDDCDSSCQDLGMAADDDDDGDGVLDVNDPEPLVTPDGVYQILPILNRGVAGPEWTVGIIGVSEADSGVDVCVADEGAGCSNIDWRFAQDPERQTVLEVEHTINTPLGWAFLEIAKSKGSNETLNLEEYRSATLSMDIRLVAPESGAVDFNTYANCLWPCTGASDPFPVTWGEWQTIEIPVNKLVQGGLDLSAVNVGFGLNPLVEQSDGVIYQVDNVRWSLRAPDLSDSDRDGLTDQYEIDEGLDPFSADTDGDGLTDPEELTGGTDPLNIDTDGDGTTDGFDAFPVDSAEFSDADGDDVGDIADNDDDNDGIDDSADLFPLHTVESEAIAADLTDANLPFGLVTYLPGADSDPAVRLGVLPQSWTLFADGSYKTNYQPNTGSWNQLGGGYVLSRETDTRVVTVTNDLQNLNWASDSVAIGNQLEVRVVSETRLAVIEQGDEIWRLAIWGESFEYALDGSITLDPTAPVRTYRGASVSEQMVVSPTAAFEPFTAIELLGSWAMGGVNQGDNASVDYCLTNASSCADIVTFNADNTAFAEVSGRSLGWSLNANGFVDLTFSDTGTQVRIRRLSRANDTGVALISIDTPDVHVNHLHMIVKRTAPSPADIDALLGGMLSSGFYITSDDEEYAHRSSIDGGLIDNFGFVLNADGTGERVVVAENVYRTNDLTWSLADSRLTSETCLATISIDNEDRCYYKQSRSWDLLKKTSDRIYVHETLETLADFDVDDVFETQSSESRNNFWELTGYYDLNDFDRDGYVNANDAFPTDETEWLDSDGDGIGDNSDPDTDTDGDGQPNGQDGDDDNDGLSDEDEALAGTDPLNRDSDGDGSTDGFDSFPLDSSEQRDSDSDGIGDMADNDDDNDGIEDDADLFPFHALDKAFIATDLTETAMPFGIVTYLRGLVDDPALRQGVGWPSWKLQGDGSYRTSDRNASLGQWSELGGGYQLVGDLGEPIYAGLYGDVQNINWDSDAVDPNMQIETRRRNEYRLAVVEMGQQTWRIVLWQQGAEYATDTSLLIDPTQPVRIGTGQSVYEIEILAPIAEFIPFTSADMLGAWTFEYVNSDNVALADHCLESDTSCSDIVRFNADGTAFTELSNRSATWALNAAGAIELSFVDNGTMMTLRRFAQGADTSVTLVGFETADRFASDLRMMVKRSAPSPQDISAFFGSFLSSSFYVTNDDDGYGRRSSIDGGYIENFGLLLNDDGTGERVSVGDTGFSRRNLTWMQNESRVESDTCFVEYQIDGELVCVYTQHRDWDLIKVTDTRVYVHETLSVIEDFDQDGVPTLRYSLSRPNFYEITPYYDVNDFDRDGYPNDVDPFPTDETEWLDSDGDGIGDNSDPDNDPDGDGVLNADDAFPLDPAASLDSDGDGYPDAWNEGATEEQISNSGLVLDGMPFDPSDYLDTDGDGVGNSSDTDDDNDGFSDEDELTAGTDPLNPDTDADGSTDGYDVFPLDAAEQSDWDGDGVGDIADNDDDNDGIDDSADLFPYSVLDKTVIPTDLTDATMPIGLVSYLRGAVNDPAVRIGSGFVSWRLLEEGTFRTTSSAVTRGQWNTEHDGYVLQGEPGLIQVTQISPDLQNIDWASEAIQIGGSLEIQYVTEDRFAVIETGPDIWKLAYWNEVAQYATDPTLVLDPSKPVRVSRGTDTAVVPILAPTATFEPFTAPELLGSWVVENLNQEDVSLTTHCSDSRYQCSDIIRFNADNTAITEISNRSATWTLTADGNVVLTFVDNGHEVTLRRVSKGAETSTVLVSFETDDLYVNGVRMMVKRSAPAPTDMSAFIGTVLSSAFSITNETQNRSSIDNGLIDTFGFVLNEDGTGQRLQVAADVGLIRYQDVTWSQSGSRVESLLCYWWSEVDGEQVCLYGQTRAWDLIKVTDSRVYVHETLSLSEDLDQDGEFTTAYSLSRPNFYEVSPNYDLDDVDRDGYSNEIDAFPFDETEWADSDGNGVGDNQDPEGDPDGDGVANIDDAFPLDAAASVDTDEDGYPDAWNANASQELIAASSLRLDAFPLDAAASVDSDGDGSPDGWNDGASESDIVDSDLSLDAFPLDVAASVDSDADGYPDEWNATASESEIAASELTLDAFPGDPTEWIDADGDGVGANTDLDDNDPNVGSDLQDPDATVTVSTVSAELGEVVRVYLEISDIEGLNSLDARVRYDPAYLELVDAEIEPSLSGWIFQSFSPEPGVLNIATTTTGEFSGSGPLIAIDFRLILSPEVPLQVTLENLLLNGGALVGQPVSGSVTELIVHRVSGSVSYWSDPSRPIPSTVRVGDRETSISNLSPDYSVGNLPTSSYTVSVDIDQSDNRAIRAYDASLTLGMAVQAIEINDVNIVAADVDRSGSVNSADARYILRYAVGLDSLPFPNQESVWVTLPESIEYPNLDTDVTDADFVGVLIGDVSGNWKPSDTVSGKSSEKSSLSVSSLSASGPVSTLVESNDDGTWDVTLSLIDPVDVGDVEFELRTTSGVTLLSHEVLLEGSWASFATQTATGITFSAATFPSAVVQDVVRLRLSVSDESQRLESLLTILDEVDYEQSLDIALGVGNPDGDDDGLTDTEELLLGTDPTLADTDGDGLLDGAEVELGTDPTLADTDGDGFTDGEELTEGTSPTDGDDLPLSGSRVWLYQIIIDAARASP